MASNSPAMQWYPKDILADPEVMTWDMEPYGAYCKLINILWENGGFYEKNFKKMGKLFYKTPKKARALWNEISCKFGENDKGEIYHKRVLEEMQRQADKRLTKSEAGKAGAKARWQPHDSANGKRNGTRKVLPMAKNSSSSSSSSSSSIKAISSFSDLAEYHISVCPAPKATVEFIKHISQKFADLVRTPILPSDFRFLSALAQEFSHRSKQGDGMGLLSAAVKRGWMKSKLREKAADENLSVDKAAQVARDKLKVSQRGKDLAVKQKVPITPTTEQRKQKMRKQVQSEG